MSKIKPTSFQIQRKNQWDLHKFSMKSIEAIQLSALLFIHDKIVSGSKAASLAAFFKNQILKIPLDILLNGIIESVSQCCELNNRKTIGGRFSFALVEYYFTMNMRNFFKFSYQMGDPIFLLYFTIDSSTENF